jgi:hypothetical protein
VIRFLLIGLLLFASIPALPVASADFEDRMSVTAISFDDGNGLPLRGASGAFWDRHAKELLICDPGHHQIIVFDQNLSPLYSFQHFVPARQEDRLVPGEPKAAVTNSFGDIFVIDNLSPAIDILDFRGEPMEKLTPSLLLGDSTLSVRAEALAVDEQDNLYVIVSGDLQTIMVLGPDYKLKRTIGKTGIEPQEFNTLLAITVAGDKIYVTDLNARPAIKVFDTAGTYLMGFGAHDVEKTDFTMPLGIAIVTDSAGTTNLWISDALRQVVRVFSDSGRFISSIGGYGDDIGQYRQPAGIAWDRANGIFLVEKVGGRVQKYEWHE